MIEKIYSTSDASTWHNRFEKEEQQWNDLKRHGRVVVTVIILFFIIIIYLIVYAGIQSVEMENLSVAKKKWFLVRLFFSILIPVIIAGVYIRVLGGQSDTLIREFYHLPEDYDLSSLIKRKLLGVIPLPKPLKKLLKYPFITLREANDLDESHWAYWFGGPASLVIYDGVAVYLERGNVFSRVLGPGLPMPVLERYETIKAVIDLRPQIREAEVETWTKDGIAVKFKVRAEIQVAASDEAKKHSVVLEEGGGKVNLVYPFDAERVKIVVERTAVRYNAETKDLTESAWDSAAMGTITGKIKAHIAGQSIDELLLDDESSPQILSFFVDDELTDKIRQGLEVAGSQLLSLQVVQFSPVDDEISDELIKYWDAKKEMIKEIRRGESEAESIRADRGAHTEAYQDFLNSLIRNLTEINEGEDDMDADRFTEASILLLTQALEESLSDPMLGSLVASEGLRTLRMLKDQLNI